jgi:hypothetical protein
VKISDERQWTWIDRKALGWPSGEWDGEPDKVHWKDEATGLDCLAVRNPRRGNWCGYVAVREDHPAFERDYDAVDVDVHGGITFADFCQEATGPERGICHVPFPGDPDRVWWLGFDCAHAWDHSPEDVKMSEERGGCWRIDRDSQYRTLEYVKSECRSLAGQLALLAAANGEGNGHAGQ